MFSARASLGFVTWLTVCHWASNWPQAGFISCRASRSLSRFALIPLFYPHHCEICRNGIAALRFCLSRLSTVWIRRAILSFSAYLCFRVVLIGRLPDGLQGHHLPCW